MMGPEVLCGVATLLCVTVLWWWRGTGAWWVGWGCCGLLVIGGVALARARELAAVAVIRDVGRDQLGSHVALQHATAMTGLWWWLVCAALVAAVVYGLREGTSPDPIERGVVGVLGVGALIVAAVTASPEVACCGLALGALAIPGSKPLSWTAGALLLGAACAGVEATFARTWLLADPSSDLQAMVTTFMARTAVWGGTTAAIVAAAALRLGGRGGPSSTVTAVVLGVSALSVAVVHGAAQQARSWGPPAVLGALADRLSLPEYTQAAIPRFVGGCVWWPVSDGVGAWNAEQLGHVSPRHSLGACPEGVRAPRGEDRPVLAVGAAHPVSDLAARGAGELQLLVRTDSARVPAPLVPWRTGAVAVQVLHVGHGRWRTLPDPILIAGTPGARTLWRTEEQGPIEVGSAPGAAMKTALDGAPLRVDLLASRGVQLTVGEFLTLCAEARAVHPQGLRCAVESGRDAP